MKTFFEKSSFEPCFETNCDWNSPTLNMLIGRYSLHALLVFLSSCVFVAQKIKKDLQEKYVVCSSLLCERVPSAQSLLLRKLFDFVEVKNITVCVFVYFHGIIYAKARNQCEIGRLQLGGSQASNPPLLSVGTTSRTMSSLTPKGMQRGYCTMLKHS